MSQLAQVKAIFRHVFVVCEAICIFWNVGVLKKSMINYFEILREISKININLTSPNFDSRFDREILASLQFAQLEFATYENN
jgi:hypothetical protein